MSNGWPTWESPKGCATEPDRYCPTEPVTRAQMASVSGPRFPTPHRTQRPLPRHSGQHSRSGHRRFGPLRGSLWNAPPNQSDTALRHDTTRAEMATFLTRALDRDPSPTPEGGFIDIAAGSSHACGLLTNQTVVCWGNDFDDQAEPPPREFTSITSGSSHSCGISTDQTATCWGFGYYGQTATPSGGFTALAAGWSFSCGIQTDRTAICWGDNTHGQTDPPDAEFAAIAAGNTHACGIRTDRTITCWGNNTFGQAISPQGEFAAVGAGAAHNCGIRTDLNPRLLGQYTGWQSGPAGRGVRSHRHRHRPFLRHPHRPDYHLLGKRR